MVAALPWLEAPLREALSARREHHALLVHGPRGAGQFELALVLAKGWLCEGVASQRPCNRCASCLLAISRNHPDLLVLLPEVLGLQLGWGIEEEDGSGASNRKPSKEIRVAAVRAAVEFALTTSARGRAKVIVLFPAESMNAIAANALLKTLEEPGGLTRFILASANPEALPATVRSRCRPLHLPVPPADEACRWLAGEGVQEPERLLAATGGQPLEALAWSAERVDAGTLERLPAEVLRGDASAVAQWPVPRVIEILQKLCHDAMRVQVGAPPRYFPDLPPMPGARSDALHEWARSLTRAAHDADHPWHAGLIIDALVLQGSTACQGLPAHERSRRTHSIHSPP